jgi:hypothetical protein
MKRLIFVLLFALTALFFSDCSSSDSGGGNGGGPVEISGNVIIADAYSSYAVYVCSDPDRSNSCADTETYVKAESDGSFTIMARADLPLVAEFYDTDLIPASGASASSLRGVNPKLVYTTPAGKSIISAFTTMVKSKVDLDPANNTVDTAANAVKVASGISDPFNAESYTGNAAATHNVITAVAVGVINYINTTLNKTVDESPAIVAAIYIVVFPLVEGVAANPAEANVSSLISTAESGVAQAIEDAETAMADAASSESWNINIPLTLYNVEHHDNVYLMGASLTGSPWSFWDDQRKPVAVLRSANTLPASGGFPSIYTFSNIISATVTSPGKISTSEIYNQQIDLSPGAKVYTMAFLEDTTDIFNDIEALRNDTSMRCG